MNKILASFVLATMTTSAFAQSNTNSPYSQFGLGDLTDQSVGFNKGMNGVGLAMRRGNEVNGCFSVLSFCVMAGSVRPCSNSRR